MAKSDARFGYKANLSREDHDLSRRFGFTTAPGMLLPIWYDLATPGDSYYMEHKLPLLRSMQLAAPAMIEVKIHFETFFVPMDMILSTSGNLLEGVKINYSSNFTDGGTNVGSSFPLFAYPTFIADIMANNAQNDFHADAFRLADIFGLCPDNFTTYGLETPYQPFFFPYQIAAYHTIFQHYFRLDDKTSFETDFCNLDKYYNQSTFTPNRGFMAIHQRPWDFDYFTSVYRSPIVSNANVKQQLLSNSIYSDLMNQNTLPLKADGGGITSNEQIRSFGSLTPNTYDYSVRQLGSTALIRQAFANEKLAMITGRTKKNYDSQVLAHFGIKVPHDVKHDITLIHDDHFDLNVQEVTNLAQSSQAALGELAGKGYSAGKGNQFQFTAPCHGVVMTIFSVEPKKRYFGGFDRINAIANIYDFPQPEFDRLGNVPMFRYECGFYQSSATPGVDTRQNSDVIAWKERYYWNKRKFDRVSFAFAHAHTPAPGVTNDFSPYFLSFRPFAFGQSHSAGFAHSDSQRPDQENRFYIERDSMDSVMLVQFSYGWKITDTGENWNSTPWLAYARDPFIVNSYISCKKVSWLSKDGEPIYNF